MYVVKALEGARLWASSFDLPVLRASSSSAADLGQDAETYHGRLRLKALG